MWGDFLLSMLDQYKEKHNSVFVFLKRREVLCHNLIGVLPEYLPLCLFNNPLYHLPGIADQLER